MQVSCYTSVSFSLVAFAAGQASDRTGLLKVVSEALAENQSREDREQIELHDMREIQLVEDEIYSLHTNFLIKKANRPIVPTPDWSDDDYWTDSRELGYRYLTAEGTIKLRAAIRAEKKLRLERILVWAPMIGAITGLVGVLTGLIAIFGYAHR
jgi:hypothetical protein